MKPIDDDVLNTELETYEKLKDSLLGEHQGEYALIHDGELAGVFDSQSDAVALGYKQFGNVPFLVKQISSVETPANFSSNTLGLSDASIQCSGK